MTGVTECAAAVIDGERLPIVRGAAVAGDAGNFPLKENQLGGEAPLRMEILVPSGKFGIGGTDDMAATPFVFLREQAESGLRSSGAVMTGEAGG